MDFGELIGLTIGQAKKKLGYWWMCTNSKACPGIASYIFDRNGGRIEVWTENNIVTNVYHNSLAEFYAERDAAKAKNNWKW